MQEKILPELFIYHKDTPGLNARQRRWISSHPFMSKYPHGVAQPALVVVREDRSVAYSMAVTAPSIWNGYGAAGRPDVDQVWNAYKGLKEGERSIDGTRFRVQRLYDEVYIRGAVVSVVSVVGVLLLRLLGAITTSSTYTALALIALATALFWCHLLGVWKKCWSHADVAPLLFWWQKRGSATVAAAQRGSSTTVGKAGDAADSCKS